MNFRRAYAIAKMEWWRILRDRMSFSLILLVPAIQIALFGAAIELNPKNVKVGLTGGSPAQLEQISEILVQSGYFANPLLYRAPEEAQEAVSAGSIQVAIDLADEGDIYENPERDLRPIVVSIDGTNAGAVLPAISALERLVWAKAAERLARAHGTETSLNQLKKIEFKWLYNPDKLTTWTLLPGLGGVVTMISMLMLGALCFAREREQGSLEALRMLPISSPELIAGKIAPYMVVALIQFLLVGITVVEVFDVPMRGPVTGLPALAILVALVHLMLGLIISALVISQLQALQAAVAFYLPSMLLSGFMFPFSAMPTWAQKMGLALPLTHFVGPARDIMLKGEAGWPLEPLFILTVLSVLLAVALNTAVIRMVKYFP